VPLSSGRAINWGDGDGEGGLGTGDTIAEEELWSSPARLGLEKIQKKKKKLLIIVYQDFNSVALVIFILAFFSYQGVSLKAI